MTYAEASKDLMARYGIKRSVRSLRRDRSDGYLTVISKGRRFGSGVQVLPQHIDRLVQKLTR